jgi:hypothetical protein
MIIAADATDSAGDEMGVAWVLVQHENAVAAKDRRRAVAFDDFLRIEIDLRENAETADDSGDRVPVHLDDVSARRGSSSFLSGKYFGHGLAPG